MGVFIFVPTTFHDHLRYADSTIDSKTNKPNNSTVKPKKNLTIESIAYGGKGIAKLDQKVYFVPNTVPGDKVICRIDTDKARFAEGSVISFEEKSPLRGASNCKYSDQCGGCQWQEIDYEMQLKWKSQFISDSITRITRHELDHEIDVSPSPDVQGYRNKVHLRGTIFPDGKIGVGYFKRATKEQIHVSHCSIASNAINELIEKLSQHATKAPPQKFRIEVQEVPHNSSKGEPSLLATVIPAEKAAKQLKLFVDEIQSFKGILWSGLSYDVKNGPTTVFEKDELTFFTSPGQFQQINTKHNHNLRNTVFEIVDKISPQHIVDLYCGSGNLSLKLADGKRRIDGYEFDKTAIKNGKFNVTENRLQNIRYHAGDALAGLSKLLNKGAKGINPDLLIVDPPRKGMADVVPVIMDFEPKDIIYISCDPTTLARDLKVLLEKYELKLIRGFDFFPNTYHVETICHLSRK